MSATMQAVVPAPLLLKPAEAKELCLQPLSLLRGKGSVGPKCKGGAVMVGKSTFHMEWESNSTSTPRPHSGDRCIPSWFGCSFRRNSHRGAMVRRGMGTAHQPLGVKRGCNGCENVRKAREEQIADGQHDHNLLHQPHGGNLISKPCIPSMSAMAVVPPAGNYSLCGVIYLE